jgi:hypothetical protein
MGEKELRDPSRSLAALAPFAGIPSGADMQNSKVSCNFLTL